ncbi:MAG TPA: hypothetical protein VFZ26_13685 [Gemmatimonadales bacterium]
MRGFVAGAVLAMLLTLTSTPVVGQGFVFGAGVGPTFSLEDGGGTDFHVMGTFRFGEEEGKPVSFRADGMLQFADGDDLFSGTLNAMYHFTTSGSRLRPYVIGGGGIYANGGTDFGINAGAGLTMPLGDSPARLFGEARFHAIFAEDTINQLPLTIGILFTAGD